MSIQLSPESEATIRELVERGGYEDEATVVAEALRVLGERDKLERGEAILWTPDFLDRLKQEAKELVLLGKPFKPEVIP